MNDTNACDYAVIGGGPSGLSLATELKRNNPTKRVVVIEREAQCGGIPLHCGHFAFGMREAHRVFKGPEYAKWNTEQAKRAKVETWTNCTALGLNDHTLLLSTPEGLRELNAKKIILATGAREASRAQRNIGGNKLNGVLSTGALQSLVYLRHHKPFYSPVIIGSELVSLSAINTCQHAGIKPKAMIESLTQPLAWRGLMIYPKLMGIATHYGITNLNIFGKNQVEYVSFINNQGAEQIIECDGVIVTGRFRPESSLAHQLNLELDPHSGGVAINQCGQTSERHVYAVGNALRPIETSSWCWREGQALASKMDSATVDGIENRIELNSDVLKYVVPQKLVVNSEGGAHKALQIRLARPFKGTIILEKNGTVLARLKLNSRPEKRVLLPITDEIIAAISEDLSPFTLRTEGQ